MAWHFFSPIVYWTYRSSLLRLHDRGYRCWYYVFHWNNCPSYSVGSSVCFTGSALVITLFIIAGATFFLLRQLVSLQRQLIHVSMGIRLHFLLFTGFRNHVFNWDRLPYLRCGLIFVLMGPAHFGEVPEHLVTLWLVGGVNLNTVWIYRTRTILALLVLIIGECTPW